MLYVLHCLDRPGALETRLANRPDHLAWIQARLDRVRAAGPLLGDDGESMVGSMFVIEADSLADARAFHDDDPYTRGGLWQEVRINPFRWTFGTPPTDA